MSRRISLPAEHGGYLTGVGAGVAAALVAPRPLVAVAVAVAIVAAFLAHAAVERLGTGKPLAAWDRPWLALLGALAIGAVATLAPRAAGMTLLAAVALVVGALLARRSRRHRDAAVETAGMAALGASAGWAAFAAGTPVRDAVAIALVLAVHAGLAVPLVRTTLRRRERHGARRAAIAAGLVLAGAAAALVVAGSPLAALALVPRALHAATSGLARPVAADVRVDAARQGVRETIALAIVVAVLAMVA